VREQDLNLLPQSARQRVLCAQEMTRSCRIALTLTIIAALAAIGAEMSRQDAVRSCDEAELRAENSRARDEHRRRLEAEVRHLAEREVALLKRQAALPLVSTLGAIAEALPPDARLHRIHVRTSWTKIDGQLELACDSAAAQAFIDHLTRRAPFTQAGLEEAGAGESFAKAFFRIDNDRLFRIVQDDTDIDGPDEGGFVEGTLD
jgi:hypothetical protein